MNSIVIDGTAAGTLGVLPKFERTAEIVPTFGKYADRQYILRSTREIRLLDYSFRASHYRKFENVIKVEFEGVKWEEIRTLPQKFLEDNDVHEQFSLT